MPETDQWLWEWEGDQTQSFDQFNFTSKEFLYPKKIRFAAARVIFTTGDLDEYAALIAEREAIIRRNELRLAEGQLGVIGGIEGGYIWDQHPIGGDALEDVPLQPAYAGDLVLKFRLYTDNVLRFEKDLITTEIFKLPGGYRGRRHFFTLEGNVQRIKRFDIATSVWELKNDQAEFGG